MARFLGYEEGKVWFWVLYLSLASYKKYPMMHKELSEDYIETLLNAINDREEYRKRVNFIEQTSTK